MYRLLSTLALGVALVLSGTARAEERTATTTKPVLDNQYLAKAISCNQAEIKIAQMAVKHSQNDAVRDFAAKLVKHHTAAQEDMTRRAEDNKVAVLASTDKDTQAEMDRLSKLQGADFDRAFLNRIIADHEKAISMCETQATEGKDAQLTTCAKEAIPTLKKHLTMARELSETVKAK